VACELRVLGERGLQDAAVAARHPVEPRPRPDGLIMQSVEADEHERHELEHDLRVTCAAPSAAVARAGWPRARC
jgi:hypothetical protein